MAVDINVLVFVLVSIVNAICIISCLCLLDGYQGGIWSNYMWIWGVTSDYSNYVYVCVIVCMVCCAVVLSSPWVCSCMANHQGSNPIGLWHGHRFRFRFNLPSPDLWPATEGAGPLPCASISIIMSVLFIAVVYCRFCVHLFSRAKL